VESQPLLGHSRAILELLDEARYVAVTHSKVLLTGESGVGKEVIAHLIHQASPRSHRPLVTINCAGVPEGLLESELFGHTRGSFTDANRDKRGLLETADGATVLLDEVGEMSMRMQSMLLRFLETGEIQRIGWEGKPPMVDVRILAATNRDLYEQTQAKQFREDLYYRLNVVHLVVPPLRARPEDVRPLFDHFLRVAADHNRLPMCQMSPEVYERIEKYHWPGNVRELRNLTERMAVRFAGQTLGVQHLPPQFVSHGAAVRSAEPKSVPAEPSLVDALYDRITQNGESFWTVVYMPFMSRDLTRETVRAIVRRGLECVKGNYRLIPPLFNFPQSDYKRFLTFLQKHECHIPFQDFRVVSPPSQRSQAHEAPNVRAAG
jgi:transcriptional regulator with GAF, ATPase, and Fis domain